MRILAEVLVALVALLHLYFLVLEMFLWTKPRTRAAFGMTAEAAEQTKVLAAGLLWSLVAPLALARPLASFFLACVLIAGVYGGFTANKRIFVVQALPAALALSAVWLS